MGPESGSGCVRGLLWGVPAQREPVLGVCQRSSQGIKPWERRRPAFGLWVRLGAACTGRLTPVSVCVSSLDRYAVFGLGSSMYPQFCAFAHDVDQKLSHLGASQLTPTGEGDELSGQEEAFRSWAVQTFKVSSWLELPHSTHRVLRA